MTEFVVKKAIKDEVNKRGMLCSFDAYDAINEQVQKLIEIGIKNAQSNGRKTVRAEDITAG
ncbi:MAG: hypothetical protein ACTSWF_03025 [Candidatus Freyarchaeota archaeon]